MCLFLCLQLLLQAAQLQIQPRQIQIMWCSVRPVPCPCTCSTEWRQPWTLTFQKPAVASSWCQDTSAYLRSPGTPDLHLKRAALKQMFHMSHVSLFMLFSQEEFAFLRQVSKGSEEAFLLAILPVVLNLKGWVVIYTMYVNFMRLRLPNVLFFRQVWIEESEEDEENTCCSRSRCQICFEMKQVNLYGLRNVQKANLQIGDMRLIDQFKSTVEQCIRQNSLTSPTTYHDKVPVTLFHK